MTLSLTIPLRPGQTATSAASALAARNLRPGVRPFCADVGIDFADIIDGQPSALAKLVKLGGFDLTTLTKCTFTRDERRTFTMNGERFVGPMLQRQHLVGCPLCLIEDMESGKYAPEINAYARAEWSVVSYRTCVKHNVAIVAMGQAPRASYTHDFAVLVRRHMDEICNKARNPEQRQSSPFERNFLARIQGQPVEDIWLNSIGFSAAARACEIFGAVSLFGPRPNLKHLTDSEWARASAAGFEILRGGIETARDFLLDLQRAPDLGGTSGPQQMFGRIYQWLEFGSEDRDLEPVRTMLRDHIVETLPVGPRDIVLGQPVRQRRVHSIRTVAKQYGIHFATARKTLTLAGIAPAERPELSDNQILFPAEAADALMTRIARGISPKHIHEYLDISRTHLRILIKRGDIRPILDVDGLDGLYDSADLDAFVDRVAFEAEIIDEPTADQVSLSEAAKRACCGLEEVLDLVWGDELKWVGCLAKGRRFGALLVSLQEIKAKTQLPADDGVAPSSLASAHGITDRVIAAMVRSGFLPTVDAINPKNRCPIKVIPTADYEDFKAAYISLRDLSRATGKWSRHLIPELEAQNILPLAEWKKLGAYIYRRNELPSSLAP